MNKENEEPKSRTYIREWKRKDYERNGDKIKAKNKAYYYKNKFGLDLDDMKLYDIHLPLVAKVLDNLNKLKEEKPELISAILEKYRDLDRYIV
tara:strand:- start:1195 stop:1473 length:279 start_codon:yes stop_codon:yes gene_type:complete